MALGVARAVFTPSVGLVGGWPVDLRPCSAGVCVVGVDVGNVDDETATLSRQRPGRRQVLLWTGSVEPDRGAIGAYLSVDCCAVVAVGDAAGLKAESLNEEVVLGRDVVAHEYGNDGLGIGHGPTVGGPLLECLGEM